MNDGRSSGRRAPPPAAQRASAAARRDPRASPPRGLQPLSDIELAALADGLDALPPPLAALDVSALDGFLCGVLVQTRPPPRSRWLPLVFDEAGQALPAPAELERLGGLIDRRHAELQAAIARRDWFDPWVFAEHEEADVDDESVAATGADEADDSDDSDAITAAVAPWVVGLAGALAAFPSLLADSSPELDEALAAAFRFLDPEELEDATGLFAAIELLEPPSTLEEAVEGLTRSVLLLADVGAGLRDSPSGRG